ncbi:hypothetical protein ACQ27_gp367 [Klebsiella phage K64-1]|nr:hypothetical protein ACQ27_gp367 [Klebsiella phage K64-1]
MKKGLTKVSPFAIIYTSKRNRNLI